MKDKIQFYEFIPFECIVHETRRQSFFLEYLTCLGQGHKLQFWIEAEKYGQLSGKGEEIQTQGAAIYDKFLSPAAYPGLNLPAPIRDEISDLMAIGRPRLYLFSRAQSFILEELKTDWYEKFLKTDKYEALLQSELKDPDTSEEFKIKIMDILQSGKYHDFFQEFLHSPDVPKGGETAFSLWVALSHVNSQIKKLMDEKGQQENKKFIEKAEVTLHTTFDIVKPYLKLSLGPDFVRELSKHAKEKGPQSPTGSTDGSVGFVDEVEAPLEALPTNSVPIEDLRALQTIFQEFYASKESDKSQKEFYDEKFSVFASLIKVIYDDLQKWKDGYFFPAFKKSKFYANIAAYERTDLCQPLKEKSAFSVTMKMMRKVNKGLRVEEEKDRLVLNTKQVLPPSMEQLGLSDVKLFGLETVVAKAPSYKDKSTAGDSQDGLAGAYYNTNHNKVIHCFRTQIHMLTKPKVSLFDAFVHSDQATMQSEDVAEMLPEGFLKNLQGYCLPSTIAWVNHARERSTRGTPYQRTKQSGPSASLHHFTMPSSADTRKIPEGSPMKTWAAEEGSQYYGCCLTSWVRVHNSSGRDAGGRPTILFLPVAVAAVTKAPLFDSLRNLLLYLLDQATAGAVHGSVMGLKLRTTYFPGANVRQSSDEASDSDRENPQDDDRKKEAFKEHLSLMRATVPFEQHSFRGLGLTPDLPIANLFKALSPSSVMQILLALTLEYPVIIHSSVRTLLALVSEALKSLMFPLCWQHLYRPLLPTSEIVSFSIELMKKTNNGLHRRPALKPSLITSSSLNRARSKSRRSSTPNISPIKLAELPESELAEVMTRKAELVQIQQQLQENTPEPPMKPPKASRAKSNYEQDTKRPSWITKTNTKQQSQREGKNWLGLFQPKKGRRRSSPKKERSASTQPLGDRTSSFASGIMLSDGKALSLPESVENNMKPVTCPPFFIGLETKVLAEAVEGITETFHTNNSVIDENRSTKSSEVWGLPQHDVISATDHEQASKLSFTAIDTLQYLSKEAIVVDLDHDKVTVPEKIKLPPWPSSFLSDLQLEIQKVLHPELETFDLLFPPSEAEEGVEDDGMPPLYSTAEEPDIRAYVPEKVDYELRGVFIKFFEDLLGRTSECIQTEPDLSAVVFALSSFLNTCPMENNCPFKGKEDKSNNDDSQKDDENTPHPQDFWLRLLGTKAFAAFLAEEATGQEDFVHDTL